MVDCKLYQNQTLLKCNQEMVSCFVQTNLNNLVENFQMVSIEKLSKNPSLVNEREYMKFNLFPKNYTDMEYLTNSIKTTQNKNATLSLYYSKSYTDYGIQFREFNCFERFLDLLRTVRMELNVDVRAEKRIRTQIYGTILL